MSRISRRATGSADSIRVGAGPADKFEDLALSALCIKAGISPGRMINDDLAERLSRAPMSHFASTALKLQGQAIEAYAADDQVIEAALAMDGPGNFAIQADGGIAYTRPGSFPNLLSNLAGKVLDEGVEQAEVSYPYWTARTRTDLPDFKASPVVAKGHAGDLDEILDGEELKEFAQYEEVLGVMQLGRFGNAVTLTPVTLANDDLGAFVEDLLGLREGLELSVNRASVRQLVANVELLDGFALYDTTNHGNDIPSGGASPSDAEWDKMEQKLTAQTTVGGSAYVRASLAVCLVPPNQWRPAIQAFQSPRDAFEAKAAAEDTNINVYRGLVTVVKEPELHFVSDVVWYGFADPSKARNATIVRAYCKGFPAGGKRERWYEPRTKCFNVSLEARFATAPKQYRTTVRNSGAA